MANYYKSASEIQEELLNYMSDDYSKEKGYWLWEILKAVACGLSDFTNDLDTVGNKLLIDKLQGDELDDYVRNWSYIERKKMAQASGYVTFTAKTGKSGTIAEGTYISNGSVNYITTEESKITELGGSVTVAVVADEWGSAGNTDAMTVNRLITNIEFIENVENYDKITGGEDEESDDSLKERYNTAMKKRANAGNVSFYEELAESVDGVGTAYCVPCPNNVAGTVDIYITNIDGNTVSSSVINNVQNLIDPNKNGDGAGEAPIGAIVTVKTPEINNITVSFNAILYENYTAKSIETEVRTNIENYLQNAFDDRVVRYNKIAQCILETEGVKDYDNLLLNNSNKNITIENGIAVFCLNNLTIK